VADIADGDLAAYAEVCGRALAQPHARSVTHRSGAVEGDEPGDERGMEEQILSVVQPSVFVADMVEHAEESAARVRADHDLFREDLDRGAFGVD
jgi:hypothetical protein